MRWTSWAFLAFVGSLIFLVLFIKDWEIKSGVERLSHTKVPPQSRLQFEFGLRTLRARQQEIYGLDYDADATREGDERPSFRLSG